MVLPKSAGHGFDRNIPVARPYPAFPAPAHKIRYRNSYRNTGVAVPASRPVNIGTATTETQFSQPAIVMVG